MFDIGWSEMAIIMLLALIVIGPKDLPRVARTVGQWVRKARVLAREFQTSLEDMARETELDEVKKEIEKVGRTDLKKTVENTIDPKGELTKAFDTSAGEKPDGDTSPGEDKAAAETKTVPGSTSNDAAAKQLNGSAETGKVVPAAEAAPKAEPASATRKPAAAKKTTTQKTATTRKSAGAPTTAAKKPSAKTKAGPQASRKTGTARKTAAPKARTAKKPAASAKTATGDAVAAKSS